METDGFNLNREIEAARLKLANEQKATKNVKRPEGMQSSLSSRKAGGRVSKAGAVDSGRTRRLRKLQKPQKKVVNLTVNDLQKIGAKAQKTNMEQRPKRRTKNVFRKPQVRAKAEQAGVSERFITKLVRKRGMTPEKFEQRITEESTKIATAKKDKEAADREDF